MKKFLTSLLCMMMVVCFMPGMAWATDEAGVASVTNANELQKALIDDQISTININNDINFQEGEVWKPIDMNRDITINGNGCSINSLTTETGSYNAQNLEHGKGASCYYYSGLIGNNTGNITINDLSFNNADIKIIRKSDETYHCSAHSDADSCTVDEHGSSSLAVVVGRNGASLTLNNVNISNSKVTGMQKVGGFVGQGAGPLTVNKCSITNCVFDAYYQTAPINAYAMHSQYSQKEPKTNIQTLNGVKLNNNEVILHEESGQKFKTLPNGLRYWVFYTNDSGLDFSELQGCDTSIICFDASLYYDKTEKDAVASYAYKFGGMLNEYNYDTFDGALQNAVAGDDLVLLKKIELQEDETISSDIHLSVEAQVVGEKGFIIEDGASIIAKNGVTVKAKGTADPEYVTLEANKTYVAKDGKLAEDIPPYVPPVTPSTPSDNVTNSGTTGTDSATTTADINTNASNGTANAVVDQTTADKIVDKATSNESAEVVVDATTSAGKADNTTVTLPADTVQQIADKTDAEVTIKTDAAEVTLDQKTVETVAAKAAGSTLEIMVEKTKDETKEMEFELKIVSDGVVIGEFDGGNVKVTVKLNTALAALKDAALTCVHIDDNGIYTKVGGAKNNDGTYTFTTTHFSSYAIMAESEADEIIAEQTTEAVKAAKLVTRTAMAKAKGKKAVKVYWYAKDGSKLSFDGYEVYRSLKRYKGFGTKPFFKTTNTKYYNTSIKKGTRYYYKVRAYKMIGEEKVYTDWSTKAWRTVK